MGADDTYKTSQLAKILGLSRDALRYYEEQGIIKPKKKEDNNYREYDFYDIYTLMVMDFYKKRSLSIREVKKLQVGSEIEELETLLESKSEELEIEINNKIHMLQKIRETKAFCMDIENHLNKYSIRSFPSYEIVEEITDFDAFLEYSKILETIDITKEDILSKILRQFSFNEAGFLDSKAYIVNKISTTKDKHIKTDIRYSKCIYTIVEDGRTVSKEDDPKQIVFNGVQKWAKNQGLDLEGVAFAKVCLVTYLEDSERVFLEIFVPIKEF